MLYRCINVFCLGVWLLRSHIPVPVAVPVPTIPGFPASLNKLTEIGHASMDGLASIYRGVMYQASSYLVSRRFSLHLKFLQSSINGQVYWRGPQFTRGWHMIKEIRYPDATEAILQIVRKDFYQAEVKISLIFKRRRLL